jgi:predicted HD superfamily hydrolase involved in NAD metabolism
MHSLLVELKEKIKDYGNVNKSCIDLLSEYNKNIVLKHSIEVSMEAKRLANIFGENVVSANMAGILHDISAVIPNNSRIEVAESLGLKIYKEEREFPLIIHQRLSKEISNRIFKITDSKILDAIGCHTTLRDNPTKLDLIIFIADKIKWDQDGRPPYLSLIEKGLSRSLEEGAFNFIKYLYDNKENLKVVHPWLLDAYEDLSNRLRPSNII